MRLDKTAQTNFVYVLFVSILWTHEYSPYMVN